MEKRSLAILSAVCLILASCNNEPATSTEVVTDTVTVTKTDTVVTEAPAAIVDTAAIVAFYEAEHAKKKGTPSKHQGKKVQGKQVTVDSDPVFLTVDAMPSAPAASTAAAAPEKIVVVHDIEMYYFIPDVAASFPGGENAFDKYLADNIEYPEKALDFVQSHTVYATAYLDTDGKITKVDFRNKPTGFGFQDEARRVLLNSPNWSPASHGGVAVKSKITIPIHFQIK